jgi:rubrerythrin
MSISFSGSELINIAIGIEGRGIVFYDVMAKSTQKEAAREVFNYLADMERGHIETFKAMLEGADKFQIPADESGQYTAYLRALVESAVFSDDLVTSEMAAQAESDAAALELAIQSEKDSILFYYEMKELMPQRAQATVDNIIAEEKSHLRQLSELKKKLAAL